MLKHAGKLSFHFHQRRHCRGFSVPVTVVVVEIATSTRLAYTNFHSPPPTSFSALRQLVVTMATHS